MDEFVCATLLSRTDEPRDAFHLRLAGFWTHMLRTFPDEYARVYAESSESELRLNRIARKYLVGAEIVPLLEQQLSSMGVDHDPMDEDDLYSKFEATPPEWFQVPH
jgi:hypothetical protein